MVNDDPNTRKFDELILDPKWVREHDGQYVAITSGEVVAWGNTAAEALKKLGGHFPKVFCTRVERNPVPVRLSTLAFED